MKQKEGCIIMFVTNKGAVLPSYVILMAEIVARGPRILSDRTETFIYIGQTIPSPLGTQ